MKAWNPDIRVQREAFDLTEELRRLTEGRTDVGAVVSFTGYCRDEGGTLAALELEHYSGMAEAEIARIAGEARARWPPFSASRSSTATGASPLASRSY